MGDVEHPPFTIQLRGETTTLTDDEAAQIKRSLIQQSIARTDAEEAAAEAAGEVWVASHWYFGRLTEERFYSLQDAAASLYYLDEQGDGSSDSIRCPDGSVINREGTDWQALAGSLVGGVSTGDQT